jgi:hypothetical protein
MNFLKIAFGYLVSAFLHGREPSRRFVAANCAPQKVHVSGHGWTIPLVDQAAPPMEQKAFPALPEV